MTERLSDINARIDGIRQLGTVVNAMRGIAAARAQQARGQIDAVDSYAATLSLAIGQTLALMPVDRPTAVRQPRRQALVIFCAEQGFAGAFSERVLEAAHSEIPRSELFMIGTRGSTIASERGVVPDWKSPMPAHTLGVPKLADRISEALYARIVSGEIDRLDAVFSRWQPGRGVHVERQRLFPLDLSDFTRQAVANAPMLNLTSESLLVALTGDYIHAQLCKTALYAFASENEARMEAMAAARSQIERHLSALQATQRIVRQEEITAEIVELAAGETASRADPRGAKIDAKPGHRNPDPQYPGPSSR
jgi:F-type H+-transporting ATPase subunit gamma